MQFLKSFVKKAFQFEAKLVLKKYKPKIIAITGSVGKSVTKEALYSVLSKKFFIRKNEKSFGAELGASLSIIGCSYGTGSLFKWFLNLFFGFKLLFWKNRYPDWLILEMDGDKPGDLRKVSQWISPDIIVVTAIGDVPSHVESFGDLEKFLEEKKYLINSIKRDGIIFYNSDDEKSSEIVSDSLARKISCSISSDAFIKGEEFNILYGNDGKNKVPTGMSFNINYDSKNYKINIFQSVGVHNEYASLLSFAVGKELGMEPSFIVSSLNQIKPLQGRMNIISGVKDSILIDDSYNSSPIALLQAVESFSKIESTRKIMVVGDMLELGKYSAEEHRKIARKIKEITNKVICVGIRSRLIADDLLNLGFNKSNIIQSDDAISAGKSLQEMLQAGDLVLIKGSQAMRLERVVEEVMKYPQDKSKLLVRQEPEWLERV